jgi:hypothetical protein
MKTLIMTKEDWDRFFEENSKVVVQEKHSEIPTSIREDVQQEVLGKDLDKDNSRCNHVIGIIRNEQNLSDVVASLRKTSGRFRVDELSTSDQESQSLKKKVKNNFDDSPSNFAVNTPNDSTFEYPRVALLTDCGSTSYDPHGVTFTKTADTGLGNGCFRASKGFSSGVHFWQFSLMSECNSISVGISQKSVTGNADDNTLKRYSIDCRTGEAFSIRNFPKDCVSPLIQDDFLMIRLDLDWKTITFGRNGIWNRKPTFSNLAPIEWFPYFEVEDQGCKFQFSDFSSERRIE